MVIRIDDTADVHLTPRAAEILRRLIEQQADIQEIPVGNWRVDFAGRKIVTQLTRVYRSSEIPAPGVEIQVKA